MLHKWIKPPTSDEYAIQFFSGMSRIFLPLLTIFSTCLLAMVS